MDMRYYNMDGEQITMKEFGALMEDTSGRIVNQTDLPGGAWVSTVLLGMDHSFGRPSIRPIIFETMVFASKDDMTDLDMDRYSTKEEAAAGHDRMVTKWTGWTPGDEHPADIEDEFVPTEFPKEG